MYSDMIFSVASENFLMGLCLFSTNLTLARRTKISMNSNLFSLSYGISASLIPEPSSYTVAAINMRSIVEIFIGSSKSLHCVAKSAKSNDPRAGYEL